MLTSDDGPAGRSLAEAFAEAAEHSPTTPLIAASAVRPGEHRLADLHDAGRRFGAHLRRLGIEPGDFVAVQLPAWAEWVVAAIGIAHAGAVILPIVSIYAAQEMRFILGQVGARAIVTPDRWRGTEYAKLVSEVANEAPGLIHIVIGHAVSGALAWGDMVAPIQIDQPETRGPDDLAMVIYTSGTTSDPKGVRHSNRTILSELAAQSQARRGSQGEFAFCPWPPGHVAGALQMMRHAAEALPLLLQDQWDPAEAARLIDEYAVTSASFTPFHLTGLLDAADRDGRSLQTLTNCLVGAAPVPGGLIARCASRGLRTYRSYGSTEHPTVTTGHADDPVAKRLTTEGRAMSGCELRFVDDRGFDVADGNEGELVVRGPELFLGYVDDSLDREAFLDGGWFRTGDIGRVDEDGFLLITDRKKDIIIRGGENISSREVEEVLLSHPSVAEAAVVAAADERMGEVVCAYVVTGARSSLSIDQVRDHFRLVGVARQKTPEKLVIVPELPRNASGKVLKQELRRRSR